MAAGYIYFFSLVRSNIYLCIAIGPYLCMSPLGVRFCACSVVGRGRLSNKGVFVDIYSFE